MELVGEFDRLAARRDGFGISKMLSNFCPPNRPRDSESTDPDKVAFLKTHALSHWLESTGMIADAYSSREKSVRHLVNFLQADSDYLLPVLRQFLRHLFVLATKADKTRKKDSEETFTMKCNKFLSQLWPNIVNDDERNYACIPLYIVGWKCAHHLNATTVVSRWRLPSVTMQLSDEVVYRYWQGLVEFKSNHWKAAEEHLSFAFLSMPAKYYKQRRCTLWRLIPAKLALCLETKHAIGSEKLFRDFKMMELGEISKAFIQGNVRVFEKNLRDHEDLYVKKEIYLPLTKLRMLLYRNLLKRAHLVIQRVRGTSSRILLADICQVVNAGGWNVDEEELECILSLLIKSGKVKGKLDPTRGAIMFPTEKSPFPRLIDRMG
uniref:PCI domain-containing protein n=1 Tax=Guillardia theta TaxID=55529 RepID=A0A7S4PPN5_GUITH|mmetsp:Transcript_8151/g.27364  ORF Transcript_8151/g.27364 Transcript_8151/m.27364 type:complete len:378 (+) Transcript_8151:2-1135(+)